MLKKELLCFRSAIFIEIIVSIKLKTEIAAATKIDLIKIAEIKLNNNNRIKITTIVKEIAKLINNNFVSDFIEQAPQKRDSYLKYDF